MSKKNIVIDKSLLSVQWLAENKDAENLVILDATVAPVVPKEVPIIAPIESADFSKLSIPGARRFDYDKEICDQESSLPHMMPSPEQFQKQVQALGINKDSVIIVYDTVGVYSSPRAWWMLRAMGHTQVAVLDGGLPAWKEAGFETKSGSGSLGTNPVPQGNFIAQPQSNLFSDSTTTLSALDDENSQVLDARSKGRFEGSQPEPRPGLRSGHMPNARNLPFPEVVQGYFMKTPEQLRLIFSSTLEGVSGNSKLVFSCGSGLTACILALGAELAGYTNLTVYDGSWSEWGILGTLPVV